MTSNFKLRSYQREWIDATHKARSEGFSRLLLDAVGGSGKTSYAGALAREAWDKNEGRTLILENRIQLVEQTAKRFADETGLIVDVEMGTTRASPYAEVVVASVASLGSMSRLTGFSDSHFEYVFADEAHNSTANLFMRIMRYFHYGAESLQDGWQAPKDGEYQPKSVVIGITATPDTHGKRNLGNFYQKFVARYSYLEAIDDGWLVGIREENIPVRIDTRAMRKRSTDHGTDFRPEDEALAIVPIIDKLAEQIVLLAKDRKTMCYLPTKECATLMSAALNAKGLKSLYVIGDCLDRDEKTEEFQNHGTGVCLCLCAMYVEGTDFPSVDTVAWMRPTLSPSFYKQGVYRMSRALPGIVNDDMTADERKAAIANSAKPYGLLISPFYISDKVNIMSSIDLFVDQAIKAAKGAPKDLTDAAKIRDYIKQLERAADKHAHKQPRTINPVAFSLSVGDKKLAAYVPESDADARPATQAEKDLLLQHSIDTTQIKSSGQAQQLIKTLIERDRLGLATPKQLQQLMLRLHWPEEKATLMKTKQAGVLIWKGIHYKEPKEEVTIEDHGDPFA